MKVHEYQAKSILSQFGIPIPEGSVASSPEEASVITEALGGSAVLKAQIHAGGRGAGGGVKIVTTPTEAASVSKELLGSRLITHQTGPEGAPVNHVLVEQPLKIAKEYYLAIVVDGTTKSPVIMASEAGGMDIEEVAAETPEKIIRVKVDSVIGLQPFQCRALAYGINVPSELIRPASTLIANLYKVFEANDCSLAEINPLAVTENGELFALDAKLNFDDDALFRHTGLGDLRDTAQEDPLEVEASKFGINYIKLDGDVGCMVNGAGLAMATMDSISMAGAMPANFLDVGGGATEEQVSQAFSILLADQQVKRILVNVFGGILRCDVAARGIVAACKETEINVPIVVRMLGTNAEEGKEILSNAGLPISLVGDLKEAADVIRQSL